MPPPPATGELRMRNINEYPIRLQEKLEALDWAIDRANEQKGDTFGGVLVEALKQTRHEVELTVRTAK